MPELDPDIGQMLAEMRAAKNNEESDSFQKNIDQLGKIATKQEDPLGIKVDKWAASLPRNITGGIYKAALNAIDNLSDFGTFLGKYDPSMKKASELQVHANSRDTPAGKTVEPQPAPALSTLDKDLWKMLNDFGDQAFHPEGVADELTQGLAQFAVPFAAYSRAFGVAKGAGFYLMRPG